MRALPQSLPERRIGSGLALVGVDEHAVMPALDFLQGIAHGVEEILIGHQYMTVEIELDDRLGLVDGRNLPVHIGQPQGAVATE
ncbi:hypothetical protein D3C71_1724470 [compost metagenome]